MAKLIRSDFEGPLGEGNLTFTADNGRIGLMSRGSHTRYDLYLSETESQRFATFVAERVELNNYETMR